MTTDSLVEHLRTAAAATEETRDDLEGELLQAATLLRSAADQIERLQQTKDRAAIGWAKALEEADRLRAAQARPEWAYMTVYLERDRARALAARLEAELSTAETLITAIEEGISPTPDAELDENNTRDVQRVRDLIDDHMASRGVDR
ncbi:hypothetical protein [Microbacterium halophytorum]|uniref:hypothetical protein n=1 Tax=Microbacterium halophytorum TaxID=2067568 RepID=UPI00131A2755|nr:hypothetical protein [Microbacterium halophytorum]